jgi:hypothetical protein
VIVGLVEKGMAKKDATGFVLEPIEGWNMNETGILIIVGLSVLAFVFNHNR